MKKCILGISLFAGLFFGNSPTAKSAELSFEQMVSQAELAAGLESPAFGDEDPYELAMDAILKLIGEIQSTGAIGPDQISLDELRHPSDKEAIEHVTKTVSDGILASMRNLRDLKRGVVRYSVIVTQSNFSGQRDQLAALTKSYSTLLQKFYSQSLYSLVGALDKQRDSLSLCRSEICVMEVSSAYTQLRNFIQIANQDLDFKNLNQESRLFWNFDNKILRASFSKTFNSLIARNEDHNAYKVLAAGLFTPLSVVGVTTFDLIRAAGNIVFNPRIAIVGLEVKKIDFNIAFQKRQSESLFRAEILRTATDGVFSDSPSDGPTMVCKGFADKSEDGSWGSYRYSVSSDIAGFDQHSSKNLSACDVYIRQQAAIRFSSDRQSSPPRQISGRIPILD